MRVTTSVAGLVALAAAGAWWMLGTANKNDDAPEPSVRKLVTGFGEQWKKVSLLAEGGTVSPFTDAARDALRGELGKIVSSFELSNPTTAERLPREYTSERGARP